jgi:hypothetical protein
MLPTLQRYNDNDKQRGNWDLVVTLAITIIGWAINFGIMKAHLDDTRDRVQRLEQKMDYLIIEERKSR